MAKYLMALDQGTTSSRCILFEKNGKIHSMAQKEFSQIYPQPGWVEHDPREIWASQLAVTTEAMAKVMAQPEDIAAIGITNQRETTIIWDRKSGEPIYNAIVWQCRRTADRIDELVALGYSDLIKEQDLSPMHISVQRRLHGSWIMWTEPESVQNVENCCLEPWTAG